MAGIVESSPKIAVMIGHPLGLPDGKQIAFVSDRDNGWDIYVMNVNGRNARKLTKDGPVATLLPPGHRTVNALPLFPKGATTGRTST